MSTQLLLPQCDRQRKEQREQYLRRMRELYAYQLTYKHNIATIKKLPQQERATLAYNLSLLANASKLIFSLPNLILTLFKGYPYKTFKDLQKISVQIAKLNQKRAFPYSLMNPKEIPNGVTI